MFETGYAICLLVAAVFVGGYVLGNFFCKEWFDKNFVNGEEN